MFPVGMFAVIIQAILYPPLVISSCETTAVSINATNSDVTANCTFPFLSTDTNFSIIPVTATIDLSITCTSPNVTSFISTDLFSSISRLQRLSLVKCKFDHLPLNSFEGLEHLRVLELRDESEDVRHMELPKLFSEDVRNLTSLIISGHGVSLIPDTLQCQLTNLEEIVLTNNALQHVKSIACASHALCCQRVKTLVLHSNIITELYNDSFLGLDSLQVLLLKDNNIFFIDELAFSNLLKIELIDLSMNNLTHLPSHLLHRNTELRKFDCSNNVITDISSNFFHGLQSLEIVNISHNSIFLGNRAKLFTNLWNLKHLYMTNNNLTALPQSLFDDLHNLQELDISQNKFKTLESDIFQPLYSLRYLKLKSNLLKSVAFSTHNLSRLTHIVLTDNAIENINISSFSGSALKVLELNMNYLRELCTTDKSGRKVSIFSLMKQLQYLDLSVNTIFTFDYFLVPSFLKVLQLTNTGISTLHDSKHLVKTLLIEELTIDNNTFSEFTPGSFPPNVKTIQCNSCKISRIGSNTFLNFSQLANLKFINTEISLVERFAFGQFIGAKHETVLPKVEISAYCNSLEADKNNASENQCFQSKFRRPDDSSVVSSYQLLKFMNPFSQNKIHICSLMTECQVLLSKKRNVRHAYSVQTLDCGYQNMSFGPSCLATSLASCKIVFEKLHTFYFDGNNMSTLKEDFLEDFHELEYLFLNNSHIQHLQMSVFKHLSRLRQLHLEDNELKHIQDGQFSFQSCLLSLFLHNNQIRAIYSKTFQGLESISELHLEFNNITEFQGLEFVSTPRLKKLYLNDNRIKSLDSATFTYLDLLIEIHLENNFLRKNFQFPYFPYAEGLEKVYLNGNNIKALGENIFISNKHLVELHLENNKISTVERGSLRGLTNLENLWLNNNDMKQLDCKVFIELPELAGAYLQRNLLTNFSCSEIELSTKLAHLHLNNNNLIILYLSSFTSSISLSSLTLHSNNLSQIEVWKLPNTLRTLTFSDNPLSCECDYLIPLRKWVTGPGGDVKINDISAIYCDSYQRPTQSIPIMQFTEGKCVTQWSEMIKFVLLAFLGACILYVVCIYRVFLVVLLYSITGRRLCYRRRRSADVGKSYHGFLMYDSFDSDFSNGTLEKELVHPENPRFKPYCIFMEEQIGGDQWRIEAIGSLISQSCVTMIVLSENAFKSGWCREAFRLACKQGDDDGCNRIIVVISDDYDYEKPDSDLRTYLSSIYTTVRWGEALFWDHLRFFLPDPDIELIPSQGIGDQDEHYVQTEEDHDGENYNDLDEHCTNNKDIQPLVS